MPRIQIEEELPAGADAAWKLVREFGAIADYAPGIESCEVEGDGVGALRTLKMGGAVIVERLESLDDAARRFSYSITDGPMPVENYLATVSISEAGADRSRIEWTTTFDAPGMPDEQAQALAGGMEGAYRGMIGGMQKALGG